MALDAFISDQLVRIIDIRWGGRLVFAAWFSIREQWDSDADSEPYPELAFSCDPVVASSAGRAYATNYMTRFRYTIVPQGLFMLDRDRRDEDEWGNATAAERSAGTYIDEEDTETLIGFPKQETFGPWVWVGATSNLAPGPNVNAIRFEDTMGGDYLLDNETIDAPNDLPFTTGTAIEYKAQGFSFSGSPVCTDAGGGSIFLAADVDVGGAPIGSELPLSLTGATSSGIWVFGQEIVAEEVNFSALRVSHENQIYVPVAISKRPITEDIDTTQDLYVLCIPEDEV